MSKKNRFLCKLSALVLFVCVALPLNAVSLYWENPRTISSASATCLFPKSVWSQNNANGAVFWEETDASSKQVYLSCAITQNGSVWNTKNRFAGPFAYSGDVPDMYSVVMGDDSSILLATVSIDGVIELSVSHDGGVTPIETITVYWLNGNSEELTLYSDGSYYSSGWVRYYDAGGGAYAGADGTTLYASMPQIGAAGSSMQHGLSSQGSGRPVEISSSDGSTYYDASGTAYYDQGDGTFVDSNGDVFNVEW